MTKKYFSIKEVNNHNKEYDCWIICNNKIYDITKLINNHPGGKNCLLKRSGGCINCLKDYNFHSYKSKNVWSKYHIGYLENHKINNDKCNIM